MRRAAAALALFALCLGAAACSRTGGTSNAALFDESDGAQPSTAGQINSWTRPHVLRWSSGEDISTLNPALNTQGVLQHLSELTMAWLVKWDHHNNAIPELATVVPTQQNGGVSKDGLTITYHLRRDAKWSDGVPFDADDVVFSFQAILNKANNVTSRTGWDHITKIDEPDKYTVVLHLSKPYSPFVETFFSTAGANPCLMPKHILGNLPNINSAPYNALPVGIGPFKYKQWNRSQRVVMVADPLYFRGAPKLKEIDYEIIPNLNTVLTQLQAKNLDMWYPTPVSFFAQPAMQQMGGFGFIKQPGYLFNHISFNVTRPVLRDRTVRQALRLATDRVSMKEKLFHGNAILQDEPAPQTAPYWDASIAVTPFDVSRANALLDGDGWKTGSDGFRVKNGVRLSLEFITNTGNPVGDQIIEMMRQTWKQVGAEIVVKKYDANLMFENSGPLYRGSWDVAFFAWGLDAVGDLSNLFACDQMPPNGQNILRWCNKRADKAMHDLYAHYDQAQRNADDAIVFQEFDRDVPMIVQNGRVDVFYFNADLRNFHPNGVAPFDDMQNVDMTGQQQGQQ